MSKPGERIWTVDLYAQHPQTGEWLPIPNALTDALFELDGLMRRVGGVVQMASRRYEIVEGSGRIETIAMVFRWRSFVPVDKAQSAPPIEQDGTQAQAEAPPLPQPQDLPPADEPVPSPEEEPVAAQG